LAYTEDAERLAPEPNKQELEELVTEFDRIMQLLWQQSAAVTTQSKDMEAQLAGLLSFTNQQVQSKE